MGKLAGRWVKILLDDSGGTPRDISSDVASITIPDEFDEIDVTGFGDDAYNSIPGLPKFDVELNGIFNPAASTGLYTVLADIVGDNSAHTLTVQIGNNADPTTGDPEFEGEFWCPSMNLSVTPTGRVELTASLRVYGSSAPAWGTVA